MSLCRGITVKCVSHNVRIPQNHRRTHSPWNILFEHEFVSNFYSFTYDGFCIKAVVVVDIINRRQNEFYTVFSIKIIWLARTPKTCVHIEWFSALPPEASFRQFVISSNPDPSYSVYHKGGNLVHMGTCLDVGQISTNRGARTLCIIPGGCFAKVDQISARKDVPRQCHRVIETNLWINVSPVNDHKLKHINTTLGVMLTYTTCYRYFQLCFFANRVHIYSFNKRKTVELLK